MSQPPERLNVALCITPEELVEESEFFLEQQLYDDHGRSIVGNRKEQPVFFEDLNSNHKEQ